MRQKMTDQGLKNYILDIALPEPFTVNDVKEKLRKHGQAYYWWYSNGIRNVLTMMVEKGFLTEKIGSEKRTDGSVTELFYNKVWKYDLPKDNE